MKQESSHPSIATTAGTHVHGAESGTQSGQVLRVYKQSVDDRQHYRYLKTASQRTYTEHTYGSISSPSFLTAYEEPDRCRLEG